jgi:hypothetical protein
MKRLLKRISVLLTIFMFITGLNNGKIIAYATTGDITLSLENAIDATSAGNTLVSGALGTTMNNPGISVYYTDFNGTKAGEVGAFDLTGVFGTGMGIRHTIGPNNYEDYIGNGSNLNVGASSLTKYMVINKTDGSAFDFKEMKAEIFQNFTIRIEGFRHGNFIDSIEKPVGNGLSNQCDFLINCSVEKPSFSNVDEIRVTGNKYTDADYINLKDGTVEYLDTYTGFFAQSFTLSDPTPTVITGSVSSITATGATLGGTIDDKGANTAVSFEYGTTTGYGSSVSATPNTVSAGAGSTAVSAVLTGLSANTTYHYRAIGTNSVGTTNGLDKTFITSAAVPTATTGSASSITATGATLGGTINDNGASTAVTFEYGTTTGYGTQVSATPGTVTAGVGSTAVSVALSGLSANTTYHFRVKGINSAGTTSGSDGTFTTGAGIPTVTGITPTSGSTAGGTNVTITGTNLTGATSVTIGGISATGCAVVNATTITATTPSGTAGAKNVVVTTPGGTGTGTNLFTYATPLSNDAGLISILGQGITAGSEAGTIVAPKTASINVSSAVATVSAGNIVKSDSGATVTFYGTDNNFTAVEAGNVSLTAGAGTDVYIKVKAADNTTLYYKVTINRAVILSNDAGLASILIQPITAGSEAGTIVAPKTASINVSSAVATVSAGNIVKSDTGATVTFYGTDNSFTTIEAGNVSLTAGSGKYVYIKVVAEDYTTLCYKININRAAPLNNDAGLTSILSQSITAGSEAGTIVAPKTASINVSSTEATVSAGNIVKSDSGATVTFYGTDNSFTTIEAGSVSLTAGSGKDVYIKVVAADNTTLYYKITINRAAPLSNDAGLTSILSKSITAGGEAGTNGAPKTASINVDNTVSTVSAGNIVKSDTGATVTFYGTDNNFAAVEAGSVSLTAGSGKDVYIKVVAVDNTTLYYKITINRAAPLLPAATTGSASSISATGATLNGTINDNGADTTVTFEYGTTIGYGTQVSATQGTVTAGAGSKSVSLALTGLSPNTTYHYRVKGTNSAGTTNGSDISFTTSAAELVITSASSLNGTIGTAYSHTFTTTGGIGSKTYAVTAGTLPPGLNLASNGILGIPTASGNWSFTVTVEDSVGATSSKSFTINIDAVPGPLTIDATPPSNGTVGMTYVYSFTSTGGIGSKTYSLAEIPPGLNLASNGILSGIPTASGSWSITLTVEDSVGTRYSGVVTIIIDAVPGPLTIDATPPPNGTVGMTYVYSFTSTGGTGSKTYSVSGILPSGLTLAPDGNLSGTPTAIGSWPLMVTVTDGVGNSSITFTMIINPAGPPPPTVLNIGTTNPSNGTIGTAYSYTLTSTGGTGSKNYVVTSGSLPDGLSLAPDGTISGIPTIVGTSTFTVEVTDSGVPVPMTSSRGYTMTILSVTPPSPPVPLELAIETSNPPSGIIRTAYSGYSFISTGGAGSKTYALTRGSLPRGLTLTSNGTLTGTPTTVGTSTFEVTVTDSALPPVSSSHIFSMDINKISTEVPVKTIIKGTASVGNALSAQFLDANGRVTSTSSAVTYTWYRLSSLDSEDIIEIGHDKTYKPVNADVGKYIKVIVQFDDKTFEFVTSKIARKSSSNSSSSSSGSRSSSSTTEIKADVTEGNSSNSISQVTIQRTLNSDGTKKDTINYTQSKAQETVDQLLKEGKDVARIVIPDTKNEVSETTVNIPSETLSTLSSGNVNLEIDTENARISLPKQTVQGLSENENKDVYFRLVPIKDAVKQQEIQTNANKEAVIKVVSGSNSVQALGNPIAIETNMSGREVNVTLPLKDINIPTDPVARDAFLKDLGIYIEHSDGTPEFVKGEIVEYSPGVYGIKFTVTKFSNFTIIKLNQPTVLAGNWQNTSEGWKYIENGAAVTGWKQVNGYWYLMNAAGIMETGWQEVNGKWYYLYSNGSMASNTVIDSYSLGSSGTWIK